MAHRLTLKIDESELFCLLGPNGAGKTTTISMLSGQISPTSGTATMVGFDLVKQMSHIYSRMGVCNQFDVLCAEGGPDPSTSG